MAPRIVPEDLIFFYPYNCCHLMALYKHLEVRQFDLEEVIEKELGRSVVNIKNKSAVFCLLFSALKAYFWLNQNRNYFWTWEMKVKTDAKILWTRKKRKTFSCYLFNSRRVIAGAIIGLLLVFYNPRVGLYWCSVFFLIFVRCFHTFFSWLWALKTG